MLRNRDAFPVKKEVVRMTFTNAMKYQQNFTYTENGALTLRSSGSALLDLFSTAGALRGWLEQDIVLAFQKALIEDRNLAMRLAFWCRDIREGLGERSAGRILLKVLAVQESESLRQYLDLIPEYGRWDDLLSLLDTPLKEDVLQLIREQLASDVCSMREGKTVSLLGKWLPGINASSYRTRKRAKEIITSLRMSEKDYRHTLAALRSYLNITEKNLSMKAYGRLCYPAVPSYAMHRCRKAFMRHDGERFADYLQAVEEGRKEIHSSVLYPYDIVEKYLYTLSISDPVLEAQWKALPDFTCQENRILVMADVSGSMFGRPMASAVGLAIYFAERAKGPFHNHFMTFSYRPQLVEIQGASLFDRVNSVRNADWEMNTDLEAAFMLILKTAVQANLPQEELPERLVIISDMQFDSCVCGQRALLTDEMKKRFARYGYTLPKLVFWNVNSRRSTYFANQDSENIILASGQSASVFSSLCRSDALTPYEYMCSVLNSERYQNISIKPAV